MMNIYLPEPYPDELLYSVVARYVAFPGVHHIYTFKIKLLGGGNRLNPFLPRGLLRVSQRTWAGWHMSGEEIAFQLTMCPFYLAFTPAPKKEQVLVGLLGTTPSASVTYLLAKLMPKTMRFCQSCRIVDITKYGETYWRRSHQMKGVAVCPDHGDELVEIVLSRKGNEVVIIPPEATITEQSSKRNLNQLERDQLLAIARRCRKILNNEIEPQWKNAGPWLYKKVAMEKGLCSEPKTCQREIVNKFKEMYSNNVIKTFEIKQITDIWVRKIFFSPTKLIFQPVAHAVVQEFLSLIPNNPANAIIFGSGPWKCPNPLVQHDSSFPIKKVRIERDKHQKVFARTICCCGFGFMFYTTDPTDTSMPVVHRVTHYDRALGNEIRRMNSAGLSVKKIGSLLRLPTSFVATVLIYPLDQNNDLMQLRREWIKVLDATEHHLVLEGFRLNPQLYTKIRINDPNYLTCDLFRTSRDNSKHILTRDLFLNKKNETLCIHLQAAAQSILGELPPIISSQNAILRKCGISYWVICRFPEFKKILQEIVETRLSFRMRKLKYLAEKDKAEGKTPNPRHLFRNAHITRKKYQKQLELYVDSLCK